MYRSPGADSGSAGGSGASSGSPPPPRGAGLFLVQERVEVFLGPAGAVEVPVEAREQFG